MTKVNKKYELLVNDIAQDHVDWSQKAIILPYNIFTPTYNRGMWNEVESLRPFWEQKNILLVTSSVPLPPHSFGNFW